MYKDKTFLKFLLCCFVTSVAILITSLCPVFALTINVGVQMAFTNIQDAIENAIDGDTVVVGDGTYTENVIIDKPITLKSKNGYESTFIASENNSDIIRITADNVIFEGFSIHSAGSDKKIIALDSVNNCIITNNKIGLDEQNKDSICIYLKNSTLNTISYNSCKFAKYGIYLDSSDMNQIIGNICSNNNVNGIYINSSKKCIVVDNQYFENNYHGISISSSESIQLNKNDCQKNTMNGIGVFSSKYCQIFNNDSSQNIENGVYLYKSQQNVIFNNTLCSNTISGIKLNSSEDNTFYANSLCDNEEYGIILENAERGPYFIDFSLNNHFYLNTLNNNLNGHIYSANTSSDIIKKPNIWHTPAKILYEFNNELFRNYIGNYYNLTSDQVDSDQNGIADQKFIFPNHEKPDPFPLVKSTDNYSVKGLWFSNDSYLHRWETFVSRETVEIKKDSSYVWFIQNSTDNDLILLKNAVWSGRLQFENNLPNGAEFFIEIGSSPDAIGFSNSGPNAFVTNKDYFYDNNNKVIVFETNSRSLKKENLSDYIAIKITSNVDCKIVTGNGGSFISLPYYHEISPPTVLDVKPAIGSIHGGTLVTIFGSGFGEFQISGKILFGSVEATSYELWSSTRIICRAPSHHYGAKDISLINDSGQKDKLKNSFLFYEDTIIVGQSEDIQQIQKAINMSKKDDTIIVKDGIYEEFIEIKKDNITLKSENGYENTTIITKTSDLPVIDITADYVTIEGFTVYGATESAGINLALNAAHCFISKNRCGIDNDHSNKTGIFIGLYSFWSFGHVYDNIVFQNICIGNDTGISFECSKYNTVTGNQCFSNNTGIYVKGIDDGLTVLSEINTVSFNTCNQNNENGIVVESSVNNMILYNVCKQNNKNGIFIQNAKKNTFFKNELSENEEFGMKTIENSQNNIIYANGFSENINGHVYSDHVSSNQWISSIPVLYQFENGFNKGFMGNYFQENQSIDSNNDGISEALFEIPEFKIMDHFALYKEINCYNIDSWFMTSDGKMYTTNNMIYPETVVINPGSSYMWTSESFSQNQSFSGLDFWSGQLVFEVMAS
jgi:parallel beta-helix repeat protein